jgi:hypothetical protein
VYEGIARGLIRFMNRPENADLKHFVVTRSLASWMELYNLFDARIPGGFPAWIGDEHDPFKAFCMAVSFAKDWNYGDEA